MAAQAFIWLQGLEMQAMNMRTLDDSTSCTHVMCMILYLTLVGA